METVFSVLGLTDPLSRILLVESRWWPQVAFCLVLVFSIFHTARVIARERGWSRNAASLLAGSLTLISVVIFGVYTCWRSASDARELRLIVSQDAPMVTYDAGKVRVLAWVEPPASTRVRLFGETVATEQGALHRVQLSLEAARRASSFLALEGATNFVSGLSRVGVTAAD